MTREEFLSELEKGEYVEVAEFFSARWGLFVVEMLRKAGVDAELLDRHILYIKPWRK